MFVFKDQDGKTGWEDILMWEVENNLVIILDKNAAKIKLDLIDNHG